uniref:Uncharacterized protein n=1 Tax=Globisporangium ultimum (strain ATCC 200006 / CBS 805.95 / DAOM BR144) TaxID=431595 RepID=K3X9M1_GLOUD
MDIHNVVHVATEHAVDADNAATHASADQSIATTSQSDDDAALLFKRKHDELDRLFIETQQDRQELARRYAAVQKQLERVHVENEYLMAELSRYSASDLESDQSDIELHYTPHTRRSLLPSPTTAESDAVTSNKAKVKASPVVKADGTTPTKDAAAKPKRRRASTSTAATSAPSTAPKKLSPKTKKSKKATE